MLFFLVLLSAAALVQLCGVMCLGAGCSVSEEPPRAREGSRKHGEEENYQLISGGPASTRRRRGSLWMASKLANRL